MANYVIYKRSNGTEIKLKLDSERTVDLEGRIGGSIQQKLAEADKMSVAAEFIAAAVPEDEYKDRRKTAFAIYDEMVENGKQYRDYLELIKQVLAAGGFLDGGEVERQTKMQEAKESLKDLAYQLQMEQMRQQTEQMRQKALEAKTEPAATTEPIQS